jgi:hypothetical protein
MGQQPVLHSQNLLIQGLADGVAHVKSNGRIPQWKYFVLVGHSELEMIEVNFFST